MRQLGFTLNELMVVLAVSAILLLVGIPSFASITYKSRLTSATNILVSSLNLARSEAIKRNSRAVLCKSENSMTCKTSGGWQQGWIIFQDANNNAALDSGEAVILSQSALPSGLVLTGNGPLANYISYSPSGPAKLVSGAWQFGTLTLCHSSSAAVGARQVKISSTGRLRTVVLPSCP